MEICCPILTVVCSNVQEKDPGKPYIKNLNFKFSQFTHKLPSVYCAAEILILGKQNLAENRKTRIQNTLGL